MQPPKTIVCVECGGVAHLLSYPDPDGLTPEGEFFAYRCADCLDRFDVEFSDDSGDDLP